MTTLQEMIDTLQGILDNGADPGTPVEKDVGKVFSLPIESAVYAINLENRAVVVIY